MSESSSRISDRIRLTIASAAAKYIAVDGINDFLAAKRKAAAQLGLNPGRNMPSNLEVEEALVEYQNLFLGGEQSRTLRELRLAAVQAMKFLQSFDPHLVGPVLRGTATSHTEITLHIFCEEPEQPGFLLREHGIPFQVASKSIRLYGRELIELPAYRFDAQNNSFILIVFAGKQKNLAPLSSIDGRLETRANPGQVLALLDAAGTD